MIDLVKLNEYLKKELDGITTGPDAIFIGGRTLVPEDGSAFPLNIGSTLQNTGDKLDNDFVYRSVLGMAVMNKYSDKEISEYIRYSIHEALRDARTDYLIDSFKPIKFHSDGTVLRELSGGIGYELRIYVEK